MKIKVTPRGMRMFNHFAQSQDSNRLPSIQMDAGGYSAAECFHHRETHGGALLPCREPELLSRALNGKEWSGLTTTMVAEDFIKGMVSGEEIRTEYPPVIAKEIASRARQLAMRDIGFVPTFVANALTE